MNFGQYCMYMYSTQSATPICRIFLVIMCSSLISVHSLRMYTRAPNFTLYSCLCKRSPPPCPLHVVRHSWQWPVTYRGILKEGCEHQEAGVGIGGKGSLNARTDCQGVTLKQLEPSSSWSIIELILKNKNRFLRIEIRIKYWFLKSLIFQHTSMLKRSWSLGTKVLPATTTMCMWASQHDYVYTDARHTKLSLCMSHMWSKSTS